MPNNSPAQIVLSVSELTFAIKSQLEPLFRRVYVRGEVTNLRKQASGHIYFSLLEGGCQLNAVFFRKEASSLPFPLKEGDSIIAVGEISIYPPKGSYQLIVREISPVGLGEALLKLQMLKKKLLDLGYFREDRKKKLPTEISTIGLVTSPTGAVLHDIINILARRLGSFHIIINPVRVQGETAAFEIARAINEFSQYKLVDVIIVCRGGGSSEDLSAFNDERIAKACISCSIPIVAAIGHETDLSITDLVADLRAPTPSAAAELVSHARSERIELLASLSTSIDRALENTRLHSKKSVESFSTRLQQSSPQKKVEDLFLRLDDIDGNILKELRTFYRNKRVLLSSLSKTIQQIDPKIKLREQKNQLSLIDTRLQEKIQNILSLRKDSLLKTSKLLDERLKRPIVVLKKQLARDWKHEIQCACTKHLSSLHQKLSSLKKNIEGISPQNTLERGYAIVFHNSEVVRSIQTVKERDKLRIMVADGSYFAQVTKKEDI